MKNDDTRKRRKPQSVPIQFLQSDMGAAAAGMLNDWKTDSLRIGALGDGPRRPHNGRRGTSPYCGDG
jgi:hypothetical protein